MHQRDEAYERISALCKTLVSSRESSGEQSFKEDSISLKEEPA